MNRRRYLINGRPRIPFQGYERRRARAREGERILDSQHGLTPEQERLVRQRLTLAIQRRREQGRPYQGIWLAALIADRFTLGRLAAQHIQRVLRGANPGDLPIEQIDKLHFVVNLKAAKALGLTIPPALLARADQIIE